MKIAGVNLGVSGQYRNYLRKAEFIEMVSPGNYRRLKLIVDLTVYQVKEIGFDLELEQAGWGK